LIARAAVAVSACAIAIASIAACADIIGVESLSGSDASTDASDASPTDAGASDACTLTWIPSSSGTIPPGAVGNNKPQDAAVTIYVCRATVEAGTLPGKLLPGWGCYLADNDSFHSTGYEVLVPSKCTLAWVASINGIAPNGAVVCGMDSQGALYACRTSDTATDPGELGHYGWSTNHTCAYTLGNMTLVSTDFQVLAQP
jgi:hypothetical protein